MQDEFYPIYTNAQAWKQIQNGVGNMINIHIKKLLIEEKDGTRISDMKKDFTFLLCKFLLFTENMDPLQCRASPLLKILSSLSTTFQFI